MPSSPAAIARRLHHALESGAHGEALRDLFTPDAITIERPNVLKPKGATADLAQMQASSSAGAGLLREQHYDVTDVIESGDTAAIRLTWTGVIARAVGPFTEGQVLTAHIAQFVRVVDERIASIETYGRYDPW